MVLIKISAAFWKIVNVYIVYGVENTQDLFSMQIIYGKALTVFTRITVDIQNYSL